MKDLTLEECTVIVATTSSPARYNPINHPESNQKRRLIVLKKMLDEGLISEAQYESASSEDVYKRVQAANEEYSGNNSTFSYFTDAVYNEVMDALKNQLGYTDTQATNLLYSGGLRIYTTCDPRIQSIVEKEVNQEENYIANGVNYLEYSLTYKLGVQLSNGDHYYYDENNVKRYFTEEMGQTGYNNTFATKDSLNKACEQYRDYILDLTKGEIISETITATIEPQTSVVIMDQSTGHVLGVVGGRGNKKEMGSLVLNRATQSTRQPGSTFKVLSAYAPALDLKGATLATTYYDAELKVDGRVINNWWGPAYVGYANIRKAIMASMNVVAVKCLENTVSETLAYDYVKAFGISTTVDSDKSPVFVLGGLTYGVTNLELTAAYAAIANQGLYKEPIFWTKITDEFGNVILENTQNSKTVIRKETAQLLTSAMEESVTPSWMVFPSAGV